MLSRCLRLEHRSLPLIYAVIIGLVSGVTAAAVDPESPDRTFTVAQGTLANVSLH
jgi:hypothetical protein